MCLWVSVIMSVCACLCVYVCVCVCVHLCVCTTDGEQLQQDLIKIREDGDVLVGSDMHAHRQTCTHTHTHTRTHSV